MYLLAHRPLSLPIFELNYCSCLCITYKVLNLNKVTLSVHREQSVDRCVRVCVCVQEEGSVSFRGKDVGCLKLIP